MKLRNLLLSALTACALVGGALESRAQVSVDVNPGSDWLGYMNVFELPANGGGFVFGSPWGIPDLTATFVGNPGTLTLGPNTIGDPDPFWYIGGGGPGAPGNKIMEANLYVEPVGSLPGTTVTFDVNVSANTLTSAHQSYIFVKDYAPDYSSFVESKVLIAGTGPYSASLATINDPARHVQYGFQTVGPDVWITDVGPYGTVVIETVPEPTTFALAGLGAAALLIFRRRR